MMRAKAVALFLGHDANVAVMTDDDVIHFELEKVTGNKHFQATGSKHDSEEEFESAIKYIVNYLSSIGVENSYEKVFYKYFNSASLNETVLNCIKTNFKSKEYVDYNFLQHHRLHTFAAYHQSGFDSAQILSYDTGGDDYYGMISRIRNYKTRNSFPFYPNIGWMFTHLPRRYIEKYFVPGKERKHALDTGGKIMGLAPYGKYQDYSWDIFETMFLEAFDYQFEKLPDHHKLGTIHNFKIGSIFSKFFESPLSLEDEANFAWLVQEISRLFVVETFKQPPFNMEANFKDYNNNVVITGGCAMNVVINQALRLKYPDVNFYVPPNPGDSGLALGMLVNEYRDKVPKRKWHYTDIPIKGDITKTLTKRKAKKTTLDELDKDLSEGNIVGWIYGGIESGPRALCHRSILADPSIPNMKNKINANVKNRESFRPFAPVCRDVDIETYFSSVRYENLEAMSYAVDVKKEYHKSLEAITHVDGTSRVQSLSREDCPWIYDLLEKRDPKVLLNTSFNVRGKPILNSFEDAFEILDNTLLDAIYIVHEDELYKISK